MEKVGKYLSWYPWIIWQTKRQGISSKVALDGFFQLISCTIMWIFRVLFLPPFKAVETYVQGKFVENIIIVISYELQVQWIQEWLILGSGFILFNMNLPFVLHKIQVRTDCMKAKYPILLFGCKVLVDTTGTSTPASKYWSKF